MPELVLSASLVASGPVVEDAAGSVLDKTRALFLEGDLKAAAAPVVALDSWVEMPLDLAADLWDLLVDHALVSCLTRFLLELLNDVAALCLS